MESHRKRQATLSGAWLLALVAVYTALNLLAVRQLAPRRPITYTDLLAEVRAGRVTRVELGEDRIVALLKPAGAAPTGAAAEGAARGGGGGARPTVVVTDRLPGVEETDLLAAIRERGVQLSGRVERPSVLGTILGWVAPAAVMVGLYAFFMYRLGRRGPLSFGRTQPKIYDQNAEHRVTFDDVAGVDEAEAELVEVVQFLKDPARYRRLGARIPKGVLLVGPPGTGKTLLARAVAGEAGVPFFSLSGSEFVELFVGVGAARMRSLFEQAKQRAPCIVFIDELDAIGKSRGGGAAVATHDEREQTLNQLLVEMDGFDPAAGVIIMAATNRPEVLDPALLRPGRFDRQVVVDRPTVDGRLAILRVHARRVKLAPDVRLEAVAQRTVGMVGADLANVVNEAALAAGRRGADTVSQRDFEEAIDRIQLGLQRRGRVMTDAERRRVAYHETGHALVALALPHADPVHRVSIVPRSIGALGVTLQLPTDDRALVTAEELADRLAVLLGGRAAEAVALGSVSTGAQNDLERATATARQMVTRFGMSDALGPVTYGRTIEARFLREAGALEERTYSEETARAIDAEVRRIVTAALERAEVVLRERRDQLERIAEALLARETLEREDLAGLLSEAPPAEAPAAAAPPAAPSEPARTPAGGADVVVTRVAPRDPRETASAAVSSGRARRGIPG